MGIFRVLGNKFKNIYWPSPSKLIIAAVILCISILLSLPALKEDIKKYNIQKNDKEVMENSTAEAQGMDSRKLEAAVGYLNNYSAKSLLVVRHGRIVLEEYYGGNKNSTSNVYSITKSFVSALTGIAIRDGLMGGTGDSLEKYFPSYYESNMDKGWKDINISHLLTMTPGFLEDLNQWTENEDWVASTFKLPLKFKPGEKFQYANSATHLLSVAVTKAVGVDAFTYANKNLFEPMEFKNASWAVDPKGNNTGYSNMLLRSRDLAKFGCLYLNGGKWNGKQLVPEEWVKESTSVQYDFNKEVNKGYEDGYGYLWWISAETGCHAFTALGYGGQSIDVIPELDLVVVVTSTPGTVISVDNPARIELLKKYIIPSIKE